MSDESKLAEAHAGESAAPARASRWRRRLALAGALVVVLAVALRAALPYAIERALPIGAERFGFEASLANVDFAVLRGHVTLEGLHVAALAPTSTGERAPDLLNLGRLFVDLEWLRLLRGEVELAELRIEKPELALVRAADGYLELPVLPPATAPKPDAEPPESESSEPLPLRLRSLSIRDLAFRLVDGAGGADLVEFALKELGFDELSLVGTKVGLGGVRISEPQLRVRRELQDTKVGTRGQRAAPRPVSPDAERAPPELHIESLAIERADFSVLTDGEPVDIALRLATSGVSFAPSAPFPLDFGLEAGEGTVSLKGELGLNPLVWDGKLNWSGLSLQLLVRAGLPELLPWLRSCIASGELDVKLDPEGVRAAGQLSIHELAFEDPKGQLALAWKSLDIELSGLTVPLADAAQPLQLALGKIALIEPQARYVLPNTAVERLLAAMGASPAESEAVAAAEPAAPASEPRVTIDRIELRGGAAEFVDRSGAEPYQGRVRNLTLDAAGVKLPERTLQRLHLRGVAPEGAPFDLRAALPGATGTLDFTLERLPLAQFSPYAASAADLRIPKGELSLDSRARLAQAGAAGKVATDVTVHQLAIDGGANAISVAGMPIDLVLALLRDPQGDIALTVPLEYGGQGASAAVGTILLGALRAAITGAVTSPIKALGMLLPEGGAREISFGPVPFAPGSASVTAEASAKLEPLAALLVQRPGLELGLVGHAGETDRLALAERSLIERLAAGSGLPELSDAGFFARQRVRGALQARGRGEAGALEAEDSALLARYLEATELPAERYAELARSRAEAVRDVLGTQHAVAPARLAVAVGESGAAQVALELRAGAAPAAAAAP